MNGVELLGAVEGPVGVLIGVVGTKMAHRGRERRDGAKVEAEATQIVVASALSIIEPLQAQIDRLDRRVKALEVENNSTRAVLRVAVAYIRSLRQWIWAHMPDLNPPDPPPSLNLEMVGDEA